VTIGRDGNTVVSVVAAMFSFSPNPIEVPVNRPVTFRLTSSDVIHGLQVVGTNANAMAIPGYVSQFTVTFPRAGEYLITCHEFCGIFHHSMVGKLIVTEAP
jgi:cytochrome c oxidase subunit 2